MVCKAEGQRRRLPSLMDMVLLDDPTE